MYSKISRYITTKLIEDECIKSEDHEIYEYSIEVVISDFIYVIIALLTAIITKTILATILFYFGFISIRKYAGGYHADSYYKCHILFLANQIVMILLQFLLPKDLLPYITIVITLLSIICIFLFAPVTNRNKEFRKSEYGKFYLYSRVISIITAIVIIVLTLIRLNEKLVFVYTFGMFSVSLSLIAEKIKQRKDLLK